jgi:HJR/Mrr/RecB family endonuclease
MIKTLFWLLIGISIYMIWLWRSVADYRKSSINLYNSIEESKQRKESEKLLSIKRHKTIQSLLDEYHDNPTKFEHFVADVFRYNGYHKVSVTSASGDVGKDIVMMKDGKKYAVEVKLYREDRLIDRPKIQKLHSAMNDIKADYGIFVTTSDYRSTCKEFADRNGIELINGDGLFKLINSVKGTCDFNIEARLEF